MTSGERIAIGVWIEPHPGGQWAHQGMTRLLGFIIEGAAAGGKYAFHLFLPDYIRDEAQTDFASLAAARGLDYYMHSPRDHDETVDGFTELAHFANRHAKRAKVVGWLSLFPQFDQARLLDGPLTLIFPDAIPMVFPEFSDFYWGPEGHHTILRERVTAMLGFADRAITFSDHVARDQVNHLYGFDLNRITSVVAAPPDLAPLLPFVENRRRTAVSVACAAAMLRSHAREREWHYLDDYPFEDVRYIAVSTQDRVTKNIPVVANAVDDLVRQHRIDARLFMTAHFHFAPPATPVAQLVENRQSVRDVVSMPNLPRAEHAAFYHAAEVAVHPAIFEGGAGTFPFYEAISVGTPCLMADGPHQRELIAMAPELAEFTFDPNDRRHLARLILEVRANRAEVVERQLAIYEQLSRRTWAQVAEAYASTAAGIGARRPDGSQRQTAPAAGTA